MKSNSKKAIFLLSFLFVLAVVFTVCVMKIDVQAIGPKGTEVGFAKINSTINAFFGTNLLWYTITDWLGLFPIAIAFCFFTLGFIQMIKRKSFLKVDKNILLLGAFYLIVIFLYIFFEKFIVNYRPVILYRNPESSYPSSHTMIVLCILSTAIMQFKIYFASKKILQKTLNCICIVVMFVTVAGRLISGVHWFTDIVGGILISLTLVCGYYFALKTFIIEHL